MGEGGGEGRGIVLETACWRGEGAIRMECPRRDELIGRNGEIRTHRMASAGDTRRHCEAVYPLGTCIRSVWILSQHSCLVCHLRCAPASPRPRLCWHAFACQHGPPSACGCSSCGPDLILPLRASLRLILFCTCPPLCVVALWPMPAWVWHDVRPVFFVWRGLRRTR